MSRALVVKKRKNDDNNNNSNNNNHNNNTNNHNNNTTNNKNTLKARLLIEHVGFPMNLIAKTASPGPGVSVPAQGPWKFVELS